MNEEKDDQLKKCHEDLAALCKQLASQNRPKSDHMKEEIKKKPII